MNKKNDEPYFLVIVGAGAVGTYIGSYINNSQKILIIESGSKNSYSSNDPRNKFKASKEYKYGERARGLGGTTNLWGGQMLPFSKFDISKENNWPISWKNLEKHYEKVSKRLLKESFNSNKTCSKRELPKIKNSYLKIHFSKWLKEPKFKKILGKKLNKIDQKYNATVKFIEKISNKYYLITYEDDNEKNHQIISKNIILATGTIESNRILLKAKKYKKLNIDKKIGSYFMDHISMPICEVIPKNRFKFLYLFNTRYLFNGNKYSVRISASEKFYRNNKLFNISSGIQVYQPSQKWKKVINILAAFLSAKILGVVIRPFGKIKLTIILEQHPSNSRSISLTDDDLPLIKWQKHIDEGLVARKFSKIVIAELWNKNLLSEKPIIPDLKEILKLLEDVNHPMGGTQMNIKQSKRIVNSHLELEGYPGLYICSASVFTTGSHSNPTMTLLALADRLIERINKKIYFSRVK